MGFLELIFELDLVERSICITVLHGEIFIIAVKIT